MSICHVYTESGLKYLDSVWHSYIAEPKNLYLEDLYLLSVKYSIASWPGHFAIGQNLKKLLQKKDYFLIKKEGNL